MASPSLPLGSAFSSGDSISNDKKQERDVEEEEGEYANDKKIILKNNSNNNNKKNDAADHPAPMMTFFGAIVGDIAGSHYERFNCKDEEKIVIFHKYSRVTDDSVLTLATAQKLLKDLDSEAEKPTTNTATTTKTTHVTEETTTTTTKEEKIIMDNKNDESEDYTRYYQDMGRRYPNAGYGPSFMGWVYDEHPKPYGSWGNGSAMRVSPIGWVAKTLDWAMKEAVVSAAVTHSSPHGIRGAQAIAAAIFLARHNKSKDEIKEQLKILFPTYDLDRTLAQIRPTYRFNVSCQGSVPEAIIAFFESTNFEDCIIKAISLGGDSDTIACMAASIAHAYYESIPEEMIQFCRNKMDDFQLSILDSFCEKYNSTDEDGFAHHLG